jgi:integrase
LVVKTFLKAIDIFLSDSSQGRRVINVLVLEILPYDFLRHTKNAKSQKSKILRTSQMKTYLEPNEVDRIEQAAECLRDKLLVRLLAHLGCRVSEALVRKIASAGYPVRAILFQ